MQEFTYPTSSILYDWYHRVLVADPQLHKFGMRQPVLRIVPHRRISFDEVACRVSLENSSGERLIEVTVAGEATVRSVSLARGRRQIGAGFPPLPQAALLFAVETAKQAARRFSEYTFEL